jgi:hypothetical protein
MSRKFILLLLIAVSATICVVNSNAQTSRASVKATEANGTFRSYFGGKYKGNYNEIKILALGNNKLKVRFDLTYPYIDGTGSLMANTGEAEGVAQINGDTAVYSTEDEYGKCAITIKFVKPGQIEVTEKSENSGCGFGFNVSSGGVYKKVSGAKPKF